MGSADFNSEHYHDDERTRSLKIQSLEFKIDKVVNEFKSSTSHCAELGVEILGVAAELKEQLSAFQNAYLQSDGDDRSEYFSCLEKHNKGSISIGSSLNNQYMNYVM